MNNMSIFVEYLRKSYDNNISVESRRRFYKTNDNFSDGCNQVYVEEKLDRLIQQRKIALEPCSFRGKEYCLLTQKNLREIYKDPQRILMTIQGFWRGIEQYKDEYDLRGPKQRRVQDYKKDRARGILLTMDFLIHLMNNYVENTSDVIDVIEKQDYNNKDTLEEDISNRESKPDYRIFKENVLSRDNHKCQCCGLDKRLHVHHIYSYTTHPELATDVTNGIVLCQFCHQKYHSVYGKKDGVNPVTFAQFIKRFGIR